MSAKLLAAVRAVRAAFAWLTRLPLPDALPPPSLGRVALCFPLVGLALGGAQALLAYALAQGAPPALCAVLVAACAALLTGALHLDGLADVFDGLGGSRGDAERALAIMRDSRIGSFGAVALILAVAARIAALEPLIAAARFQALLLAPAAARAAVVPLIAALRYARPEGLGKAFHEQTTGLHAVLACALAGTACAGFGPIWLLPASAGLATSAAFGVWLARKLGGLTGDGYGAAIELAELAFLIAASITAR